MERYKLTVMFSESGISLCRYLDLILFLISPGIDSCLTRSSVTERVEAWSEYSGLTRQVWAGWGQREK